MLISKNKLNMLALVALVSSPTAFAGEYGNNRYPANDISKSVKNRAEVVAEVAKERADGHYWKLFRGYSVSHGPAAPGLTREQVVTELKAVTPEERRRMAELYTPGG